MTTSKLTETLDSISDKAFGFNKASSEPATEVHETAPVAHYEEKTETLDTAHAATAEYPVAEHPTEHFASENDPEHQQEQPVCEKPLIRDQQPFAKNPATAPAGGEHAVNPDPYPHPPLNLPIQNQVVQGHNKPVLKTGPEQDFTVATVASFMGIFSLLMMFDSAMAGLLAIVFGVTAVYYGRKAERAGVSAGLSKTLGWFSFFGGIIALFAVAFFLLVALVVAMVV